VAHQHGWAQFVSIRASLFEREIEKELLPACRHFGIGVLPYFPLASGFLTGKYRPGQPPPSGSRGEDSQYVQNYMTEANFAKLAQLTAFAQERQHTINELAHAWLLAHPEVSSVISGATKVEHVLANAKGCEWSLSPQEIEQIRTILEP
jgi:aryl-alcohol dehydrogenase-like predicted oxidoreductase